jgi:hypothetical protein
MDPNRNKTALLVLFIPSVERDGVTPVDQDEWVDRALEIFGRTFGGATAYPRAKGIWRDDARGGALVKDQPVVMHCYSRRGDLDYPRNLDRIRAFCRRLGREARQGEVGLVVGDHYLAITDFSEDVS